MFFARPSRADRTRRALSPSLEGYESRLLLSGIVGSHIGANMIQGGHIGTNVQGGHIGTNVQGGHVGSGPAVDLEGPTDPIGRKH